MRIMWGMLIVALLALLIAGCPQRAEEPADMGATIPEPAPIDAAETADTVKLEAYINVASGCQKPTVEFLHRLQEQYADTVEVEIIDFGSPEGAKRWQEQRIGCQALLFNGSPVVRFPDDSGRKQTVVFYYPAGFNWTHTDLRNAFAALESGEAEILSEEEAREALTPRQLEIDVAAEQIEDGAALVINGEKVITITETVDDMTPIERAEAAAEAIAAWASEPIHPTQMSMAEAAEGWSIMAKGEELIHAYPADAEAAGVTPGRKIAGQWFGAIKSAMAMGAQRQMDAAEDSSTD